MKKNILVMFLVATMVLVACGTATVPEVTSTSPDVTVPTPETVVVENTVVVEKLVVAECNLTPPAELQEITYLGWGMPLFDQYNKWLEDCSTYPTIDVNVRIMDNSAAIEQMSLSFASGGPSPFAIIHQSNSSIQQNVWKGWLTPLNDLVDKYRDEYNLDDIDPGMWDGVTFGDTIYGIPLGANAIMLHYRSDLFEKYNLKPPTTYDEIIADCEVLKNEPGLDIPFGLDLSAGWAWEIAFREALYSLGGSYFVGDTNQPAFNSPEGVAALNKLMEVVDACMGEAGLTYNSSALRGGLGNGSIAFIHTWASSGVTLTDPNQSDMWDKIAFAPAASVEPGGKLAGSAWGDFWAIPANYDGDVDLVFRMIMESGARADHQQDSIKLGMVSRTSVLQSDEALPFSSAALETIAKGVGATPRRISMPTMSAALGNWLPLLGTGEMTPAEVLQAAEDEYIKEATAKGYLP